MLDGCLVVSNFYLIGIIMNDLSITMHDEQDQQDYELMEFECWYHSVIDDLAGLIRANGYDKVMFDVMCAVKRMSESQTEGN
jgi:hypothetical protein